jgi:hypothetical protein
VTEIVEITARMLYPRGERDFVDYWASHGRARGWLVYHTHDSRRSAAGFPDLVFLRDGAMIVAECKWKRYVRGPKKGEPKGLRVEQVAWLDAFREMGKFAEQLQSAASWASQLLSKAMIRPRGPALVRVYVWTPGDEDEMVKVLE